MFEKYKYFRPLDIDMSEEWGCKIIGVFGYSIARVDAGHTLPSIPRKMLDDFEQAMSINGVPMDNKMVIICQDTERFGTESFALYLHDLSACIGKWSDVTGYSGELELKEE